jgi:hypothetical protein
MPSPTAGLFGGLATGIFGRMREHEDEQKKLDFDERQGALKSLGSLLEHATPETRPVIYKQMADVMKLKGKHRGVWDMLTGQGREDYHNQLSQKLDGVFGNVMGPKAYEAATTAAPTSGNQEDWQDESAGLTYTPPAGKIALRDPISEHLEALKSQYGLQNDRRSQEIELRNKLTGEREVANDQRDFDFKSRDRDHAAQIAAEKKVRALATSFALQRQSKVPSDEEYAKAAEQVAKVDGLNIDKLKAQIGLIGAEERRNDAWAQSLGEGGAGRPMTENQLRTFDAGQQTKADAAYKQFNDARSQFKAYDEQYRNALERLQTTLSGRNLYYKDGQIFEAGTNTLQPNQMRRYEAALKEIEGLQRKSTELKGMAEGHRSTLGESFKDYFEPGEDIWGVQRKPFGGPAPAGAPRTAPPPDWRVPVQPKPTAGLQGQGEFHDQAGAKPRKVGEIIDTGKGKIRVVGIKGKGLTGGIEYIVEGVQ